MNEKDSSPDPETQASDRQMLRVLREMVARLPQPYRQVIELRLERELTTGETARQLGVSRSNVATRLDRGRRMLKSRFEAWMRRGNDRAGSASGRVPEPARQFRCRAPGRPA